MRLKKRFEEYITRRETVSKPVGFISIDEFFDKHLKTRGPYGAHNGIGATRKGLDNFTKTCEMISDLGRMGVLRNVDETLDAFEDKFRENYNYGPR